MIVQPPFGIVIRTDEDRSIPLLRANSIAFALRGDMK
jgi:hypothetical protein